MGAASNQMPAGSLEASKTSLLGAPVAFGNSPLLPALFDAFPQALLLVEDQHIVLANPAGARLLGCENPLEILGQALQDFFSLERRFCHDLLESSSPTSCRHPSCENILRRPSGEQINVEAQCTHFKHGEHDLLLIALRELSQVEVTRAAHNDHLRFRTIFDGAGIGIGTTTLDGRIIESNPALTKILGYSAEEFAGMHARQLHPGDFQPDEQLLNELMEGRRESFELDKRFRRKDGSYVSGHLTVSLMRDSKHHPAFLIAMVEDTTARKRAEEQLRAAEKMEVIGRLAGGVAHDFNNILTGILLYCDLALGGMASDNPVRAHLQEIRIAGEQGAALTQQLLHIARKQTPQPRPVQLNEVLGSTQNLLRRLIGEQIELITVPGSDLGMVHADSAQLRQVILNLTLNARDAMPQGGRITISTHSKTIPQTSQPAVSLVVEDDGCGMDAETLAHLFEPFFTTKKAGRGTGLGLATVQRIVNECGGKIEVQSETGRGTRVEVLLPVIALSS